MLPLDVEVNMKNIAIFVRSIDAEGYPFNIRDLYFYSYQEYLLAFKSAGMNAYFVTDNSSYRGGGNFLKSWTINEVTEVKDFIYTGPITADIVFNKADFRATDVKVFTDPRLHDILSNKARMYEKFSELQPLSAICINQDELAKALKIIATNKVVIKQPEGNGGRFVKIFDSASDVSISEEEFPVLVQEFIDMSAGIPGLAIGIHDLRILFTGNQVIGATLREPATGKLYANVSQGGSERLLSVDEIPNEALLIAKHIDNQLPQYPRYYAADFALGSNGWKLVELNEQPGLFRQNNGPLASKFMNKLANYVKDLA